MRQKDKTRARTGRPASRTTSVIEPLEGRQLFAVASWDALAADTAVTTALVVAPMTAAAISETPTVLSDNLSAASAGTETVTSTAWLGASFTTDASVTSSQTYTLDATLLLSAAAGAHATLSLYSGNALEPTTFVGSFTSPASLSTALGQSTFTAAGLSLTAGTTYWVVLKADAGSVDWSWAETDVGVGAGFTHAWASSDDSGATWFGYDAYPMQYSVSISTKVVAAPTLSSITVNDGTAQRSQVTSVTLAFDSAVTLAAGAATLSLLNSGGSGANDVSAATDVSAQLATPTTADGGKTWVYTFTGGGSLADGAYTLTVNPTKVTSAAFGTAMAIGASLTFHRLFGDVNGDKVVNNADYFFFRNAFGSTSGNGAYVAAFDFDGGGAVNNADYFQFRNRFGKSFTYSA